MNHHPSLETFLGRAIRLKCPRCGTGRLFAGFVRMNDRCPDCNFKFERAPGYFLGSTYINYAFTAFVLTIGYVYLRFGLKIERDILMGPLIGFCILFPLLFFRFARSLWLNIDCYFDRTGFESDQD